MNQQNDGRSPTSPLEKIDMNLSSVFGTSPMDVSVITANRGTVAEYVVPDNDADVEKANIDTEAVRSNLYSLMQQGNDALQYSLDLAKQADNPRAFEVFGGLMKQLADMNMQLLDLHEKKQKLKSKNGTSSDTAPQSTVTNNVVFNGSTADLNRLLNDMKNGK